MGDADGFSFGFGSGNFCFSGSCLGAGVLLGFLSCGTGGVVPQLLVTYVVEKLLSSPSL